MKTVYLIVILFSTTIMLFSLHPAFAQETGSTANAAIMTMIYGQQFDYSSPAYQTRDPLIYFSNDNGQTIHRIAHNQTLGSLFDSLNIGFTDTCFTFSDKRSFCTNVTYSLKFFINHQQVSDLRNYVTNDNDRILISYGNENDTQIQEQLRMVDSIKISSDNSIPSQIPVPPLQPQEMSILEKENDPNKLIGEGQAFLSVAASPLPAYYYFDKALKLEPSNSTAKQGKDQAYAKITSYIQAISNADTKLSKNPHDQEALITKAQELLLLGEYGQTTQSERDAFDNALTNSTTSNFIILAEQYRTLDLMGKYNETLPIVDKLIGEFAGHAEESSYLQGKAISLYKVGRYDEASSVLDQSNQPAQAQLNGNPNTIYDIERGIIYEKMGRQDLANKYYDFAGSNPEAATNGSLNYIKGLIVMMPITMGDYETALEYFDKIPPTSSVYGMASIMKVVAQDRLAEASTIVSANSTELMQLHILPTTKLPTWVKNIFIWYGQDKISEDELISALKFLIAQGIIKI
jgi:tetratricopeptide (TPR) repeat protein